METVFDHYTTYAWQTKKSCRLLAFRNPSKIRDDMVQINFVCYKLVLSSDVGKDVECCKGIKCPRIPQRVAEALVPIISREKLLKHRDAYAKRYGKVVLSYMFGVPESERGEIIDKMFEAVEKAVPMRQIEVFVMEVRRETSPVVVAAAAKEGLKAVTMTDLPQDESAASVETSTAAAAVETSTAAAAAAVDTSTAAAASTGTSSDKGVSKSTQLVDEIVSKKSISGDKEVRPRRSTKVPGYLKDFVQNKGKYCVLYS